MEYKTKNDDRNKNLGSGMGLCVVSNVIKKLGGEFIVQSKQDGEEMTSFEIRIPYYGDLQETTALDSDSKKTYLLEIIERQLAINRLKQNPGPSSRQKGYASYKE